MAEIGKSAGCFHLLESGDRKFDHSDGEQHKRILKTTFSNIGWKVPDILDAVRAFSELYFDSVSRVELAGWARGRIAFLGDAS
jgi:hypothetical protein